MGITILLVSSFPVTSNLTGISAALLSNYLPNSKVIGGFGDCLISSVGFPILVNDIFVLNQGPNPVGTAHGAYFVVFCSGIY